MARALASLGGLPDVWGPVEPDDRALELARPGPSRLQPRQRVMLQWAWDVWSGSGGALASESMDALDSGQLKAVGALCTAIGDGPDAIDAWLESYQGPTVRPVG